MLKATSRQQITVKWKYGNEHFIKKKKVKGRVERVLFRKGL